MSKAVASSITLYFWHKRESHEKKLLHVSLACHRAGKQDIYVSFWERACSSHLATHADFHTDVSYDRHKLGEGIERRYTLTTLDVEKVVQAFLVFKDNMNARGSLGYGVLLPSFPKTAVGLTAYLLEKGGVFDLVPDPRKTVLSTVLKVSVCVSAAAALVGVITYNRFPKVDTAKVDLYYGSLAREVYHFERELAPLLASGIRVLIPPLPGNDPLFQRGQQLVARLDGSLIEAATLRKHYFYKLLSPVGLNRTNSYNLAGFIEQRKSHIFKGSIISTLMMVAGMGFYHLNNRYLTGHFSSYDLITAVMDAVEKEAWLASQPRLERAVFKTKNAVYLGGFFIASLAGLAFKWWNRKL
jgi:hypothetical protein